MGAIPRTLKSLISIGLLAIAMMPAVCVSAGSQLAYAEQTDLAGGSFNTTADDGLNSGKISVGKYDGTQPDTKIFDGAADYSADFEGISYDRSQNTLTLSDVNLTDRYLYISSMGPLFKIDVVGTNTIQYIDAEGCSLNFVGNGSLALNESGERYNAIWLNGLEGNARITAAPTVNLLFRESSTYHEGCVYIKDTTAKESEAFSFAGDTTGLAVDSQYYDGIPIYEQVEFARCISVDWNCRVLKRDDGNDEAQYFVAKPNNAESPGFYVYKLIRETEIKGMWVVEFDGSYSEVELDEYFAPIEIDEQFYIDSLVITLDNLKVGGEGYRYPYGYGLGGWFYATAEDDKDTLYAVYMEREYYLEHTDETPEWTCYKLSKLESTAGGEQQLEYCSYYDEGKNPFTVDDVNGSPAGFTIVSDYTISPGVYEHTITSPELIQTAKSSTPSDDPTPTPTPDPTPTPTPDPTPSPTPDPTPAPMPTATGNAAVPTATVGGAAYKVSNNDKATAVFQKAPKNKKSITIPASVKINGKTYAVVGIAKNAFKGVKAKTVTIKSKKLTKKSVKGCFKGAKNIKTVKIKVGNKKTNRKFVKRYKKIFTKANCGKKVAVK